MLSAVQRLLVARRIWFKFVILIVYYATGIKYIRLQYIKNVSPKKEIGWTSLKMCPLSPGQVAQWLQHCPVHQKVAGSIPGQGTCLGYRFDPHLGPICN